MSEISQHISRVVPNLRARDHIAQLRYDIAPPDSRIWIPNLTNPPTGWRQWVQVHRREAYRALLERPEGEPTDDEMLEIIERERSLGSADLLTGSTPLHFFANAYTRPIGSPALPAPPTRPAHHPDHPRTNGSLTSAVLPVRAADPPEARVQRAWRAMDRSLQQPRVNEIARESRTSSPGGFHPRPTGKENRRPGSRLRPRGGMRG